MNICEGIKLLWQFVVILQRIAAGTQKFYSLFLYSFYSLLLVFILVQFFLQSQQHFNIAQVVYSLGLIVEYFYAKLSLNLTDNLQYSAFCSFYFFPIGIFDDFDVFFYSFLQSLLLHVAIFFFILTLEDTVASVAAMLSIVPLDGLLIELIFGDVTHLFLPDFLIEFQLFGSFCPNIVDIFNDSGWCAQERDAKSAQVINHYKIIISVIVNLKLKIPTIEENSLWKNELNKMLQLIEKGKYRSSGDLTGNQSNITIFYLFTSNNNQEFMEIITSGPFQITNTLGSKQENNIKGHQWPKQELIKYAVYLKFSLNAKENGSEVDFNSWPFFRKLSLFIQSKNPNQCRILHKKMMSDHSSIDSLLTNLKTTIQKFQEWEHHYESSLSNLKHCLSREREEVEKELTTKNTVTNVTKLSIDFEPKVLQNEQPYHIFVKEDKQLGPTGLEYEEQKQPKYSTFEPVKAKARPSFSFCMEEQGLANDDLSMFNSTAKPAVFSLWNQKTLVSKGLESMAKDCQDSFINYVGKLNNLSNFMGSSLYDY